MKKVPTTMYEAEVTYEIDSGDGMLANYIIERSDVFATPQETLDDLIELVGEIVFQGLSIRQRDGIENPYADGSDIEGCAMMVATNDKNCTDDDRKAAELVDGVTKWIKSNFDGSYRIPKPLNGLFQGRIRSVNVYGR